MYSQNSFNTVFISHSQSNGLPADPILAEAISRIHESFKEHLISAFQSLQNNLQQKQPNGETDHNATEVVGPLHGQLSHDNGDQLSKPNGLQTQLTEMSAANETLRRQLATTDQLLAEKCVEASELNEIIKNLNERLNSESIRKQLADPSESSEQLSEIGKQMADVRAENKVLKQQLATADNKFSEKIAKVDMLQQRLDDVQSQLATVSAKNAELEQKCANINRPFMNWRTMEPKTEDLVIPRGSLEMAIGPNFQHELNDADPVVGNRLESSARESNFDESHCDSVPMDDNQSSETLASIEPAAATSDKSRTASPTNPTAPVAVQPAPVQFECFICKQTFRHLFGLNMHMKTNHIRKEEKENRRPGRSAKQFFVCKYPNCGKTFANSNALRRHRQTHTPAEQTPLTCKHPDCGKTFAHTASLKQHSYTHATHSPFVCKERKCGLGFNTKSHLELHHLRNHTTDRPFVCKEPECDRAYASLSDLNYHKQTHTGKRPYKCKEPNCGQRFFAPTHLKDHLRSHTGAQPYVCKQPRCGMKFTRTSSLYAHMRVVHNQEPLEKLRARF